MMTTLGKPTRFIVERARQEARDLQSPTVEAEHLLLAISSQDANAGKEVLLEFGLDHDALIKAIGAEMRQSLGSAGINMDDFGELKYSGAPKKNPGWGTSAMKVLERALELAVSRGDRKAESPHLLLAILKAQEGTVPRMLHAIDVDQAAMARRTEQEILRAS